MDRAELTAEEVRKREIPWQIHVSTKLITGTCVQLLRCYEKGPGSQKAALLDEAGIDLVDARSTLIT